MVSMSNLEVSSWVSLFSAYIEHEDHCFRYYFSYKTVYSLETKKVILLPNFKFP